MSDPFEQSLPEDLKDLERSLSSLKPEGLDSVSKGRLSSAIIHADAELPAEEESATQNADDSPSIRTRIAWGAWGSLAAAVSLAVGLNLGSRPESSSQTAEVAVNDTGAEVFSPSKIPADATALATQSELKQVVDEGIILTESSSRMRQVRTLYTDTVSWTDPVTEARLQMSYDREELFLIPIDAI
ncbi:MAG: hypothetical protein AAGB06_05470 [Verrucomicrobiota bacterium]